MQPSVVLSKIRKLILVKSNLNLIYIELVNMANVGLKNNIFLLKTQSDRLTLFLISLIFLIKTT